MFLASYSVRDFPEVDPTYPAALGNVPCVESQTDNRFTEVD